MTNNVEQLTGFDDFINGLMEKDNVPGLAIAVIHKGDVILSKGYGLRDVDKKLPVTPETIFAIGSCSKAFTSMTVGMLVDDGKLKWDEPVRTYLPDFRMYDLFATEHMTPRDLLCHRSGLPRHDLVWYGSPLNRRALYERLRYLQPSYSFRASYNYQNLMFMTAGYLVGQVTNSTWESFTQARIFDKLGMTSSNFSVTESQKADNVALPYMVKDEAITQVPFRNIDSIGPAGSINSNLIDMQKWLLLHLKNGKHNGEQLISEENLKLMHTPQVIVPMAPDVLWRNFSEISHTSYALGWGVKVYRGHTMVRHMGGIDGFISSVSFMPQEDIGVIVLTNSGGSQLALVASFDIYDRLLGLDRLPWAERFKTESEKTQEQAKQAREKQAAARKPDTHPSHPLTDYAGDYEHPGYGVISVQCDEDGLKATYNGLDFALKHYHYDTFELPEDFGSTLVDFFSDQAGDIQRFVVPFEPLVAPIEFRRVSSKN